MRVLVVATVALLALLVSNAAYGQSIEVSAIPGTTGRVSTTQDGMVRIENIRMSNPASSTRTTGTIYVGVRVTTGSRSTSGGYHLFDVNHHPNRRGLSDVRRITGIGSEGRLAPGRHFDIHRLTHNLWQPSAGTYYVHITVYQWNTSLRANGAYTQIGSLTFGDQWTFSGRGGGDDHGNTQSSATRVALQSATDGRIEAADDADFFRFEVDAERSVTIETSGGLDTVGTLYDGSGRSLATDDDGGTDYNFRIRRTLSAGTHYVRVESYGSDTGAYTLRLSAGTSSGGDDHGNSRSSATRVALPSATGGRIQPANDVDFFRFEVYAERSVTIETSGGLDTVGTLYDGSGRSLATNDDGGNGFNFRIARRLATDTYYVRVESFGSEATGAYTLRLSAGTSGGDDHGDARSSATRVALPSATGGRIEAANDADYFRFEVDVERSVTIETSGGLDTLGTLYDGSGRSLATNDDGGNGFNFRIGRTLSAGTHYVRVESYGSATGAYTLRLATDTASCPTDFFDTPRPTN